MQVVCLPWTLAFGDFRAVVPDMIYARWSGGCDMPTGRRIARDGAYQRGDRTWPPAFGGPEWDLM